MHRRLAVPLVVIASACIMSRNVEIQSVARPSPQDSVDVATPVKAHLIDGSTVMFRSGVLVQRDTVWGEGTRYDLTLRDSSKLRMVPLDSIVGMEAYRTKYDAGRTVLYSTLATVGAIGAGVAIACAIDPKCFGSCPTFYADSAGTLVLEAEGFSYSIAQLFEARDVDRLRVPPDSLGTVRLEVRNEAFETHYINHLELLEVRHSADELAVPDEQNRPFVIGKIVPLARAVDRAARDVRVQLAAADGRSYHTASAVLENAGESDLLDWIELAVPAPSHGDSAALVLRLRNSLLNTILFYDIMLGDPGARSLDWVGKDLEQVGEAVALAQWYQRRMGLDVSVLDRGGWRVVAHLKDTGPVAWKDVAIAVPVVNRDSIRIRISFPADNWRIDRVQVATTFRRLPHGPTVHPLVLVRDAAGAIDTVARAGLASADQHYLEVAAAQRFEAEFSPGTGGLATRTFFLASQGYYTEWVRNGWLRAPRSASTFRPGDGALAEAIQRWRVTQDTLEARFMATRVPVR